jgi:hypothetical protein
MLNKQKGEKMKTGFIEGRCSECKKTGPYNEVRAYSLKEYDRIEFAFCSANCAQIFEDAVWHEKFYGMDESK